MKALPTRPVRIFALVATLVLVSCGGEGNDERGSRNDQRAEATVPETGKAPEPARETDLRRARRYDFAATRACLAAAPSVSVQTVRGRPLGGSEGTLRVDFAEFQTQVAFAGNPREAKAIEREAIAVAQAVGATAPERYVNRWANVVVSWGAIAPTPDAVSVIALCLEPAD
jgi:hypothetical protein